jgi:hypothetical protein
MDMNLRKQFEKRIDERAVARVLECIATTPNRREKPTKGDIPGRFDVWFDGGAVEFITGCTKYVFVDGTHATVGVTLGLTVAITFPDGCQVTVRQEPLGHIR